MSVDFSWCFDVLFINAKNFTRTNFYRYRVFVFFLWVDLKRKTIKRCSHVLDALSLFLKRSTRSGFDGAPITVVASFAHIACQLVVFIFVLSIVQKRADTSRDRFFYFCPRKRTQTISNVLGWTVWRYVLQNIEEKTKVRPFLSQPRKNCEFLFKVRATF